MKSKFGYRLLSLVSVFNIFLQSFTPFLAVYSGVPAFAGEPVALKSEIKFDSSTNKFKVLLNNADAQVDGKMAYILAYQTDKQTEGIPGETDLSLAQNFEKEIYAGTCSANGTCVPHNVLRGILKIKITDIYLKAQRFVVNGSELKVEDAASADKIELSEAETQWLNNGGDINPTATPTVEPTPQPTATPLPVVQPTPEITVTEITPTVTPAPGAVADSSAIGGAIKAIVVPANEDIGYYVNPYLVTDKPDYSPTDTVILQGTGFSPNTSYNLKVTGGDYYKDVTVTADAEGNFVYSFQLDGIYRPDYVAQIFDAQNNLIAFASFTDSRIVASATVNGGSSVTVNPGESITISVTANLTDGDDWHSTGYRTASSGSFTCVNTPDHNSNGTHTESFNINAPAGLGTYNLYLRLSGSNSSCSSETGSVLTLNNAIVVAAKPTTVPAYGATVTGSCINDIKPDNYNCTANDVGIASVSNVTILDDGCQSPSDTVTFRATWDVQSTSNRRYNVGLWFGTGGQASALNGTCSTSMLPNSPVPPWFDYDSNACGDINSSSTVHPEITMTVKCLDINGNNKLDVPYCTTWENNPSTCNDPLQTIPGTPSKCNCNPGFTVPITVPYGANIEVVKDLNPSSDPGKFNLQVDGATAGNGTNVGDNGTTGKITVGAGTSSAPGATHTVGETAGTDTNLADYTSNISCVDRGQTAFNGGAALTAAGTGPLNVTVDKDDDIVCTITNGRNAGNLTVTKTVNWNGVTMNGSQVFDICIQGPSFPTTPNCKQADYDGGDLIWTNILPGDYAVTEPSVGSEWSVSLPPAPVTVTAGGTATVTVTNTRKLGNLDVVKTVDWNGAAQDQSATFAICINGPSTQYVNECKTTGYDGGTLSWTGLIPGSYTVSETDPGSDWDVSVNSSPVNVPLNGGKATVNVTNAYVKKPQLIVKKIVVNDDGGNLKPENFSFSIGKGSTYVFEADGENDLEVDPGAYTITEAANSGYSSSYGQDCDGQGNLTLKYGDVKTCTITNNDKPGTLVVKKNLVNDNGGTKSCADFSFAYSAAAAVPFDSDCQNEITVPAGKYTVSETAAAGYVAEYDNCTDMVIVNGGSATCTITNRDIPAKLTVTKIVNNGKYGTLKTADFPLFVNSTQVTSGQQNDFNAGTYKVSETDIIGYKGSIGGDCAVDGSITLKVGDDKSCTITNDAQYGRIIVNKVTDPVGTGQSFTFSTDFSAPFALRDGESKESGNLLPGTYAISETAAAGWESTNIVCSNGSPINAVEVEADETVTCTFTNSRKPVLTVIKHVVNNYGSQLSASDFGITISNANNIAPFKGSESGSAYILDPGGYLVDEAPQTTHEKTLSADCSGVLAYGDVKTCTITNNDKPATLVVKKTITNDNGGNLQSQDFSFDIGTGITYTFEADGENSLAINSGSYKVSETNSKGYAVTYGQDCDSQGNVTVANGETKTCTVNNDDIAPRLSLKKSVVNNDGGAKDASDWTLLATNNNNNSDKFSGSGPVAGPFAVSANSEYILSETGDSIGYEAGQWSCNGGKMGTVYGAQTVTLQPGDDVACAIENDDKPATVSGSKFADMNMNGIYDSGDSYLDGWTIHIFSPQWVEISQMNTGDSTTAAGAVSQGEYKFGGLSSGSYFVCEDLRVGWGQISPSSGNIRNLAYCQEITLANGQLLTGIDFANIHFGSISGAKFNDLNGNGHIEYGEPALDGTTISGGLTVFIDSNNNGSQDQGEPSTVIDANGEYHFADLLPGDYSVCERDDLLAKWLRTYPAGSSCQTVTVNAGEETQGVNFANAKLSDIHGYKWNDIDESGGPSSGPYEERLAGWTIDLYKWDGSGYGASPLASMVTSNDENHLGWYWFENLMPGQYKICEQQQTGWQQTYPQNSDGSCHIVNLPDGNSGQLPESSNYVSGPEYNFGNIQNGEVIVYKFEDLNKNGTYDQNEPYLADWEINMNQGTDVISQKTGEGGSTQFTLKHGDYVLSENQQENWHLSNIYCEDAKEGVKITADGEAYGHHGACSGWNGCGDAATCALWACEIKGYDTLLSYGDQRPCTQFNNCNLFNYRGSVQYNWGNWCNVMGVTDIYCSNGSAPTPTPTEAACSGGDADGDGILSSCDNCPNVANVGQQDDDHDGIGNACDQINNYCGDGHVYENEECDDGNQMNNDGCSKDCKIENISLLGIKSAMAQESGKQSTSKTVRVEPGKSKACYIGNYRKAKITVIKNVFAADGKDISDNTQFTVEGSGSLGTMNLTEATAAEFIVDPGTYNFKEINLPTGYGLHSITGDDDGSPTNGVNVTVASGGEASIILNNYLTTLTLSKYNTTWPDNTSAGSDVDYILTLKVGGNPVNDIVVTDLPPAGFKPVGNCVVQKYDKESGQYVTIKTYNCSDIYHSPAKWELGDGQADDIFRLLYTAAIDSGQKPGLYRDLAWAAGCQNSDGQNCDQLLALAVDAGTSDPGIFGNPENPESGSDRFVGTKVQLAKSEQDNPGVNVKKEETGEVLGASTSLPATGSDNGWTVISFWLLVASSMMIAIGVMIKKRMNKKMAAKLFGILLITGAFFLTGTAAMADTNKLYIRLEQPKSPTRLNDFTLSYATLDLNGNGITVRCYIKKPGEAEKQMGSDISVIAGGNNGFCPLTADMINAKGTYQFRAEAISESGTVNHTISVDYNTEGPGTPTNYAKDKKSDCVYEIRFRTADDGGKTSRVEIYRSDSTSFTADSGTRIKEMSIGSNQDGSYTDNVPDCSKTYYYVLRAFDSADNGSGFIGDSVTVVSTSSTTTTTTTAQYSAGGAIPVANVTLPEGGQTGGNVLGEEANKSSESGNVLGEQVSPIPVEEAANATAFLSTNRYYWIAGAVLGLAALAYGIYLKKRKRSA